MRKKSVVTQPRRRPDQAAYERFLSSKAPADPATGFDPGELHAALFPFQREIVRWALRRGRAAIFADCGLGKSLMQLDWARHVAERAGGPVLILAPLAVAQQTEREARKFSLPGVFRRQPHPDADDAVVITNYEMIHRFDPARFAGVVLDESSILKAYDGKTRTALTEMFRSTAYRLCCTATPSPNDHIELGNHAEFLGTMTRAEMLAMFFVHDGGSTQDWKIKGHAVEAFWDWVCGWAVMLRTPHDVGHLDATGFNLPPLEVTYDTVETSAAIAREAGLLFVDESHGLVMHRAARKASLTARVAECARLVRTEPKESWVIWCDLNPEGDAATAALADLGAVQVAGADDIETKEQRLLDFAEGRARILVSKPSIAGHGMNWQHCARQVFLGLSYSYEAFYQAVRRSWRFGQTRPVHVRVVVSEAEMGAVRAVARKKRDHDAMVSRMQNRMRERMVTNLRGTERTTMKADRETATGRGWTAHLGDCVDVVRGMKAATIDYTIFSPPFASLYTYTNATEDMGNCRDHEEFARHFAFLVPELLRVTKPGRLLSFHCMNLPTSKARDGYIGLSDFRGTLIRTFQEAGWIYHSEVVIWKDPVTAMQRTKALGLLHKQLKKDSAMSRQGIPDYLVTMRKPGENAERVAHSAEDYPVSLWQRIASPVWMDIDASDTLSRVESREEEDERHICPLQLEVIRRALRLWTNPGDLVLSPFAGIASEGYVAVTEGREFVGVELKRSYWEQARRNLDEAVTIAHRQQVMFAEDAP